MAWHKKIGGWTRKEAIEREGSLKSEWAAKSKADLALPLFLGPRMADYTRKNASERRRRGMCVRRPHGPRPPSIH